MSAGRYYRVTPRFWQDSDVRNEWTEDMRMLAIYLMTSPHRNMVGLFYCPLVYIESDLQWQSKRLRMAFDALVSADFIRFDEKAQVILIVNGLKHDSPSTGNQVAGAIKVLHTLPRTPLLKDLLDAATMECECLANAMRSAFDWQSIDLLIPYPYTVPVTASDSEPDPESAVSDNILQPDDVATLWNDICGATLSKCRKLTDTRRRHVKARLREEGRDDKWWRAYFLRIASSPFLAGKNERQWQADFEWATSNEDNVVKVLEGKYDPKLAPGTPSARPEHRISESSKEYLRIVNAGPEPKEPKA